MGCNACTTQVQQTLQKQKKVNGQMRLEVIKCIDCLKEQPDLAKYQYQEEGKPPALKNIKKLLGSKVFGGSVLVKRLEGRKNSLKKDIETNLEDFLPRFKGALGTNREKFYTLENVQLQKGGPEFVDIWIYIESIEDQQQRMMLESLHELTSDRICNWKAQMLYPYSHKFLLWDDIAPALSGYGRFMYFRSFSKCLKGSVDPTVPDSAGDQWITVIKEGRFEQGKAEGYQRHLSGFNGHCKLGFFTDDEPYGKFVVYDAQGKEWKKEGLYFREHELIREEKFESFEYNYPPDVINQLYVESRQEKQDVVPTPHQLENAANLSQASLVSGISSLTQQEEELEREKEKLMAELGDQMAKKINVLAKESPPKKKKPPRVIEAPRSIGKRVEPPQVIQPTILQIEQVDENERGRDLDWQAARFDDRFRNRYNLRDVKIVDEVIEL